MGQSEFTPQELREVYELRKKYIGKRFCIYRGKYRGHIGVCRWIELSKVSALNETVAFYWYRIEVEIPDGYYLKHKSYIARKDEIIRIQDEPDEVPYYSGW